ncbi:unnamed protein product [Orchesella dallaii]|uniref:CRAL-TRIO domain-containing protein n=1 Tax=Orchesella dallaii TaxID=48710 RepID=A0ABP1PJE2_9HEXA
MNTSRNYSFELLLAAILIVSFAKCQCSIVDDDLTITQSQKQTLDMFRARMSPIVPHAYMRDNIYLIRWLRAKNFNLKDAELFLRENLKWRKSTGMDKIHSEDYSKAVLEFPIYVDAVDKNGAPVITCLLGVHDIRQAHLTGRAPMFLRFVDKIMDEAEMKVRNAQLEGKNVTRFQFVINLDGFNLVQHGCPNCVVGTLSFLSSYENHFPWLTDKIVIINAPPNIQAILQALRSAITDRTRRQIKIFGTDKNEWQKYLLSFIDKDQLTEDFGGTLVRHN